MMSNSLLRTALVAYNLAMLEKEHGHMADVDAMRAAINAVIPEGLGELLNEVSAMLTNNQEFAERMGGFRYPMTDELRGFALMFPAGEEK